MDSWWILIERVKLIWIERGIGGLTGGMARIHGEKNPRKNLWRVVNLWMWNAGGRILKNPKDKFQFQKKKRERTREQNTTTTKKKCKSDILILFWGGDSQSNFHPSEIGRLRPFLPLLLPCGDSGGVINVPESLLPESGSILWRLQNNGNRFWRWGVGDARDALRRWDSRQDSCIYLAP